MSGRPVELLPITAANVDAVLALSPGAQLQRYVAPNSYSLAEAFALPRLWTRAIACDGVIQGFLMVDTAPDYGEAYRDGVFLWRLMVAEAQHRSGIGSAAMRALLKELTHWPGVKALYLSYVDGEDGPRPFYERIGFARTGALTANGEIVMRRAIAPAPPLPSLPGIIPFPLAHLERLPHEAGAPPTDRIVEGAPLWRSWVFSETADKTTIAGVWESTEGAWRVAYDEWEFCVILSGFSEVVRDGHAPLTLGPGAQLVIEPGFTGLWRVREKTLKSFVIRTF